MVAMLEDTILDTGLTTLDTVTTFVWICQAEPTTLAIAATSGLLGFKSFAAGGAFGAPAAGTSPTGRKVASTAITDGTITTTGTASWWAVGTSAALHAHGSLSSAQAVTSGNTFSLASFEIRVANQ
jgi:hypothetical protein